MKSLSIGSLYGLRQASSLYRRFPEERSRDAPKTATHRLERLRVIGLSAAFFAGLGMIPTSQAFATTYDVSARGTLMWGLLIVTGSFDTAGDYDFKVEEGGPSGYIYNFTQATGLTQTSKIPPLTMCYIQPCTLSGPGKAVLSPGGDPTGSGFISFGLADSGETFSATGTATAVPSGSPQPVKGVPETSTWAMMLLGFAGLGFARYLRSKKGCPIPAAG